MSNLSRQVRARAVQLAILTLASAAPWASAQSQGGGDLKAITAHTLTMPKYKQYLDATINLANAIVKSPELAKRLDGYGDESLADQVKLLEGLPQVRGAVTSTGLTARDYVLTQAALLQSGMAYAMTKDGSVSADKMVEEGAASRANLEFYRKNEAEIGRLAKEAEARAPKVPKAAEE